MVTPPAVEPVSLASVKIIITPEGDPSITDLRLSPDDNVNAALLLYIQHGVFTDSFLTALLPLGPERHAQLSKAVIAMQNQALQRQKDTALKKLVEDLSTPVVDQLVIGSNYASSFVKHKQ